MFFLEYINLVTSSNSDPFYWLVPNLFVFQFSNWFQLRISPTNWFSIFDYRPLFWLSWEDFIRWLVYFVLLIWLSTWFVYIYFLVVDITLWYYDAYYGCDSCELVFYKIWMWILWNDTGILWLYFFLYAVRVCNNSVVKIFSSCRFQIIS